MKRKRKVCAKCHKRRSASKFSKNKSCCDGLQSYCRDCMREVWQRNRKKYLKTQKKYYQANHEQKLAKAATRYQKDGDTIRGKKKKKYAEDPAFRERQRNCVRRWSKRNPKRRAALETQREARKKTTATEPIDREKVFQRENGLCYLCGRKVAFKRFELEHVVPLSKNGSHTYDNVRVAHKTCNLRKGTRLLVESSVSIEISA